MVTGAARILSFAGAAWLAASCPGARACDLPAPQAGTVASVVDGETLEARAKRLGVWSSSLYRVVSALHLARLGRLKHSYQLVEGAVAAVSDGGGRVYLNFAKDWRSDFTISVDRKDAPAAGIELKGLAGKRLRVLGFLAWRNGPMIEASHPEQIELQPEASKQNKPPPQPTGLDIAL